MKLSEYEKQFSNVKMEEEQYFSSPTSIPTFEQTRIFQEYRDSSRLLQLIAANSNSYFQIYKKFLKDNRLKDVEVSFLASDVPDIILNVLLVGRDFFVGMKGSNLILIPYAKLKELQEPIGLPQYTNSHQFMFYDNQIRKGLLHHFSDTVQKNKSLRNIFYEESLESYLTSSGIYHLTICHRRIEKGKNIQGKVFIKEEELDKNEINYYEVTTWQRFMNVVERKGKRT